MYYTAQEVARHNGDEGTFWVIIHGDVHDVTPFLKEHPGGEEILMNLAGKDGTECFEDIGHSPEARKLRMKYKIGEMSEAAIHSLFLASKIVATHGFRY